MTIISSLSCQFFLGVVVNDKLWKIEKLRTILKFCSCYYWSACLQNYFLKVLKNIYFFVSKALHDSPNKKYI